MKTPCIHRSIFKVVLSLSVAGLCSIGVGACAAGSPAPEAVPRGPFALPGGGSEYISFDNTRFVLNGTGSDEAVPQGAGAVRGAAMDLRQGFGVVVFEHRLAIVDLAAREASWIPFELGMGRLHVAARDGIASITTGTTVEMFDLVQGQSIWREEASGWLRDVGLSRLEAAVPLSRNEFCLVGSKPSSLFGGDPKVVLQKVNASGGAWQMSTRAEVTGMSRVDCSSVDGDELFLGGVYETVQMATGTSAGRLWQTLVTKRVDLKDFSQSEVVWLEQQARETRVRQIAAGKQQLALLLDGGSLLIFSLLDPEKPGRLVFEKTLGGARSVAWVGPAQVVVTFESGERLVDLSSN